MKNKAYYTLITDITCDLPTKYYQDNDIKVLELTYSIDDKDYKSYSEIQVEEFYAKMRSGSVTKTSQISPDIYKSAFMAELEAGHDILYIAFSSGLSGSYNSARVVAESLREEYPERKLIIVDSLCASLGEGLLLAKAVEQRDNGLTIDQLAEWLENNKLHLIHLFTVNDLMYLHRGGRVSKASAIAGSVLGIKPLLHVDTEGHLIPVTKVRGRKQSLEYMVEQMGKIMKDYDNKLIAISHGDCIDDAKYIASLIKKRYGISNVIINHVGLVIGSHSGPGTMALFFMGEER